MSTASGSLSVCRLPILRGQFFALHETLTLTHFVIVACEGQKSGLSLFVGSYSANVECIEDQPFNDDGQCSELVDFLLVGPVKLIFARPMPENPHPGTVIVPVGGKKISEGEYICLYALSTWETS